MTAPGSIIFAPENIPAWFRNEVKDDELADEAASVEADDGLDARQSREEIIEAVRRRYTAPAD